MNIQYRRRKLTTEQKIQIATDYNAGIPVPDIMKKYGIAKSTVYGVLRSLVDKAHVHDETCYEDKEVHIH